MKVIWTQQMEKRAPSMAYEMSYELPCEEIRTLKTNDNGALLLARLYWCEESKMACVWITIAQEPSKAGPVPCFRSGGAVVGVLGTTDKETAKREALLAALKRAGVQCISCSDHPNDYREILYVVGYEAAGMSWDIKQELPERATVEEAEKVRKKAVRLEA